MAAQIPHLRTNYVLIFLWKAEIGVVIKPFSIYNECFCIMIFNRCIVFSYRRQYLLIKLDCDNGYLGMLGSVDTTYSNLVPIIQFKLQWLLIEHIVCAQYFSMIYRRKFKLI